MNKYKKLGTLTKRERGKEKKVTEKFIKRLGKIVSI